MSYSSLWDCIQDLEKHHFLIRIQEEVDPYLEMALIHRILFRQKGPAILYENIKNSTFPAVSNLFGTYERARFILRHSFSKVKNLIEFRAKPDLFLKKPYQLIQLPLHAIYALPKKVFHAPVLEHQTKISKLPAIINWKNDGGPFITLPIVLSYDVENPHILKTNLGMYRIQLQGNQYQLDQEIGLHYQIHRSIGIHHTKAIQNQKPLKVSIFVGGPPAHILSAIMPLPENVPEISFAGVLANRRFRYLFQDEYFISGDADFCILGEVQNYLLPEGPFGDHLGYYSLKHNFPVLKVKKVFHRKNAIWPFTVVGRPPQEDTIFGKLIHELTESMIPVSLPGVKKVHAVDESGVHPLLLAIGSERYLPYLPENKQQPMEILTQANAILGFNQLSLAKYLWIVADEPDVPDIYNIPMFFQYLLERIDFTRDIHFITNTTMDTLDYSGTKLNFGSKVIFAATNPKKRNLSKKLPPLDFTSIGFHNFRLIMPGIMAIQSPPFRKKRQDIHRLIQYIESHYQQLKNFALIILCDNVELISKNFRNFLWITFTRSNPASDIHAPFSSYTDKHWIGKNPIIIDARRKPNHAPILTEDKKTIERVKELFRKGRSLEKFEFMEPD